MSSIERIGKHYDEYAAEGEYNEIYKGPIFAAENFVVAKHITEFIKTGDKVLDFGCGDGLFANLCEERNLNVAQTGIDLSHILLKKAVIDHPDQRFLLANMHQLPFPDEYFDHTISLFGPFSYSLDPKKLVFEIERVTKPEGSIILMPYTLRTMHSIELGGESTAVAPDIPKIFYTSALAYETFSRFPDVKVQGINYFANPISRMAEEGKLVSKITGANLQEMVTKWSVQMGVDAPTLENGRFDALLDEWKRISQNSTLDSTEEYTRLLEAEADIAKTLPAELARHMIVTLSR